VTVIFSRQQHTVKKAKKAAGIGLHSGKAITFEILPSPPNSGIQFLRSDMGSDCIIPARSRYIVNSDHATSIGIGEAMISTVEHLMAALLGAGIDNAIIKLDGPEVPAMDGSAAPFLRLLKKAGRVSQSHPRRYLQIIEPFSVVDGDKSISVEPAPELYISFDIDFPHPLVSKQHYEIKLTEKSFAREISKARTFGFLKEVEFLRRNGLAQGGSLDNAVVIGDRSILNQDGLRFEDEFVRHKILDLLGDLYLIGMPIIGRIKAVKSGHRLHQRFVQELLARPYVWRVIEPSSGPKMVPWTQPLEGFETQLLTI